MILEDLKEYFDDRYWDAWHSKFGHDFLAAHWDRTLDYIRVFIERDIAGRNVLEVGGYPGLLVAVYLRFGATVSTIDSPKYIPEPYLRWTRAAGVKINVHDILTGAPNLEDHYDVAVMSDVLLHNDGFPTEFMSWLVRHAGKIYLVNYGGENENVVAGKEHTLEAGFSSGLLSAPVLVKAMSDLGAKLVREEKVGDSRILHVFEGVQ